MIKKYANLKWVSHTSADSTGIISSHWHFMYFHTVQKSLKKKKILAFNKLLTIVLFAKEQTLCILELILGSSKSVSSSYLGKTGSQYDKRKSSGIWAHNCNLRNLDLSSCSKTSAALNDCWHALINTFQSAQKHTGSPKDNLNWKLNLKKPTTMVASFIAQ